MEFKFAGSRALLLGGSCQLALGLADVMIPLGLYPLLSYRDDRGKARINEALDAHVGQYDTLFLDLATSQASVLEDAMDQDIAYLVDFVQEDLEGLVASLDSEKARVFFETHIAMRAMFIQRIARRMLARGHGRMVYISSAAAGRPNTGQGFYAAAKCAAEALYRNLGLELASRGITTVTLRPGYIDAGRGRRFLKREGAQATARVPLGRTLTIAEVADAVLFLLSDSAVGFNATVLTMDGGLSAGK